MPTPTLDAGTFLIYNIHTSRYLFTVWNAVSGSPAYTSDFVNESSPDVNRFVVTNVDGKYSFLSLSQNLYLAGGYDKLGNAIVVWSQDACWWAVSSTGLGIWTIHYPEHGLSWTGDKSSAELTHMVYVVETVEPNLIKHQQWRFFAA
jgi:hypothetical protein